MFFTSLLKHCDGGDETWSQDMVVTELQIKKKSVVFQFIMYQITCNGCKHTRVGILIDYIEKGYFLTRHFEKWHHFQL